MQRRRTRHSKKGRVPGIKGAGGPGLHGSEGDEGVKVAGSQKKRRNEKART